MVFENFVLSLTEMSFFHLFLPWLLVLAVTYGVMQKQELFEEESVTATVSIAISFLAIGGFYTFAPAELFGHFAAVIGFALFGFIGLFILLAVVGVDITGFENPEKKFPAIAAVAIVVLGALGVLIYQFDLTGLLPATESLTGFVDFEEHVMPVLILGFILSIVVLLGRGE